MPMASNDLGMRSHVELTEKYAVSLSINPSCRCHGWIYLLNPTDAFHGDFRDQREAAMGDVICTNQNAPGSVGSMDPQRPLFGLLHPKLQNVVRQVNERRSWSRPGGVKYSNYTFTWHEDTSVKSKAFARWLPACAQMAPGLCSGVPHFGLTNTEE